MWIKKQVLIKKLAFIKTVINNEHNRDSGGHETAVKDSKTVGET